MRRIQVTRLVLAAFAILGCEKTVEKPTASMPEVVVATPVTKEVTDYAEYTGRTEAPQKQEVRARVSGYIVEAKFQEGKEVKEGDVLFVIDPRPFEAELGIANGQLDLAKARAVRAVNDMRRADEQKKTPGVISQEEYDRYVATKLESEAAVRAAEAQVQAKQLNLDYSKVKAEIAGRVSRINYTVGNLVGADNVLTNIVSQDPMYVYFDVDEPTMLRIQDLIRQGKFRSSRNSDDIPVFVGLSNETETPHQGMISFVDNKVDPATGTLKVRATIPNPMEHDTRRFSPGNFVKVRLPFGEPQKSLLVSERALGSDQGQKFVYVVTKDGGKNIVEYRPVQNGPTQKGGLRVVFPIKLIRTKEGLRIAKPEDKEKTEESINAGDLVIVNGLQRARPGLEVKITEVPMPTQLPLLESKEVSPAKSDKADKAGSPKT